MRCVTLPKDVRLTKEARAAAYSRMGPLRKAFHEQYWPEDCSDMEKRAAETVIEKAEQKKRAAERKANIARANLAKKIGFKR